MQVNRTGIQALYTANAYTTALAVPAVRSTIPAGANTTSAIETANFPAIRFSFGGTDTNNQTLNYQIIGWSAGDGVYVPKVLASGVATLSATTMAVAGLDTAATLLADTITETLGLGGVFVRSPANERMADITVWPGNCSHVTIETDRGTAVTASVYFEMLDEAASASVMATFEGNIGNVGLLNTSEVEVNPATNEAVLGTGLPIPMTFADPAADTYTAAQATTRATTRLRVIVANSGVVISLDGGTTDSITLMPNMADDVAVNIPLGTLIAVKRYTAGTAFTGLIVEVR